LKAIDIIRSIGTVEQAREAAAGGLEPARRLKNNTHVHLPPNFSAFDSIAQVLERAREEDVTVMGVTNYYYHDVYDTYANLATDAGVFPLFGIEVIAQIDEYQDQGLRVNDPGNPGRMYFCGKGITRFADLSKRAAELMEFIRQSDEQRMALITEKLSGIFARAGLETALIDREIVREVAQRHGSNEKAVILQERHVARAFQEALFEKTDPGGRIALLDRILGVETGAEPDDAILIQKQIRSHLIKAGKPAFVEERFVNFEQAFELVTQLGGIPCYPTLADGSPEICEYEQDVDKLVENIKSNNIHAAEFIPVRNEPDVLEQYVRRMREANLVVVAGTEHNTMDMLSLDPMCKGAKQIPEEINDIFWEGACVCAAHMFLVAHNECGFVDDRGNPNPEYETAAERIEAFSRLGRAVIQMYFENNETEKP
jgi:hypothetical protein